MPYQVILVGASGLIGSHLLSALIESTEISRILLVLRKPLNISIPKVQELIVNFDELEHCSTDIKGDIMYSCLGTTKTATPDSGLYRKIDFEYPLKKFRSTKAEIVARTMLNQSLKELKGTFIYPSIQIQELA
ncbi:hypothetical protein [Daejeonella sp.]|uniref:hypothetical protein n=1 Tax=Daejeonella sp. TaxID=2805397 RepID=UPI00271AC066|nr:hypothetical protein [Daejeonella sp.]MDO8993830.1 hypothetical protein [Daejeonella sp.]MDP2413979.1 hypothetical protein [Daejeonella sp.]